MFVRSSLGGRGWGMTHHPLPLPHHRSIDRGRAVEASSDRRCLGIDPHPLLAPQTLDTQTCVGVPLPPADEHSPNLLSLPRVVLFRLFFAPGGRKCLFPSSRSFNVVEKKDERDVLRTYLCTL